MRPGHPGRITHKRGDTFRFAGKLPDGLDLSGAALLCQLRTTGGVLIDTIDAQLLPDGVLVLHRQDTSGWRVCTAEMDVQFTLPGGDVISTNTVEVSIERDVSHE